MSAAAPAPEPRQFRDVIVSRYGAIPIQSCEKNVVVMLPRPRGVDRSEP